MAEQLKEKLEEKGMECCHCHQKATPRSEKERKQLPEPFKPHDGTTERYQPDVGRKPILRRYPDAGSCGGERPAGFWLCNPEGAYGDLRGGRDPEGEYCYRRGSSGSGEKIEISRGMTADKTVNLCGKALKITETLQVMERQGYFMKERYHVTGMSWLRMLFACGKGSQ